MFHRGAMRQFSLILERMPCDLKCLLCFRQYFLRALLFRPNVYYDYSNLVIGKEFSSFGGTRRSCYSYFVTLH